MLDPAALVGLGVVLPHPGPELTDARSDPEDRRHEATSRHRRAQSSPRRAPVVIASHTSMPQSGSVQAVVAIVAAWVGVGGCGSAFGSAGGSAWRTGLLPIQRHRTARVKAPLRRLWVWRTDEVLSGRQQ
jgi:hypothetical protein